MGSLDKVRVQVFAEVRVGIPAWSRRHVCTQEYSEVVPEARGTTALGGDGGVDSADTSFSQVPGVL